MKRFQFWWLKISCFLTGYNFYILINCSEVSSRKVKKYAAALLIVATVWAFVGYSFCNRYIKLEQVGSMLGALIAIFIIVQIERQILLADKANSFLKWTRFFLAMLMAVVGSLIIDQIIFKDDIDKNKIAANQDQVNSLMPGRSKEILNQIIQINSSLQVKENERRTLLDEINKNPTTQVIETTSNQVPVTSTITDSSKVSTTKTVIKNTLSKTIKSIQNPKFDQLPLLDAQLVTLNKQKSEKEQSLLQLKTVLEDEIKQKVGFLDELNVMIDILKESVVALIVYVIWFLFLLILELLIIIGKANDTDSDYDKTIQKQMDIHLRKINLL